MEPNYVIHPIPLQTIDFPKPHMTYLQNYGQTARTANFVWYIEGPSQKILVDAGITAERLAARGYKPDLIQTLDEGLKKLGLEVGDIDIIIATHSHHDHIATVRRFPKAKVIIQKTELEFVRNPPPFFKAIRPKDNMELLEGVKFEVVEGDTKIDNGIELLFTPGHTPGGQSVAVKTAKGIAVITGWCCIQENFDPPMEIRKKVDLPFMLPGVHTNPIEAYDSIVKVRQVADLILPVHEVELVKKNTIP
ncbi:MAG: N-acyl homoserine lactonase family protein [Thermodesulfobacteriota bacterium]